MHGRFPAVVLGAAAASLVWLVVVTTTVTSPGQARAQRTAPKLPTPAATLTERVLRQTTWHPCERRSEIAEVTAPTPPPGERSVVTAITTAGTKVATGTVLAGVSGRPLIAVVTDAPLYRDLTLGARGPDVLGLEQAFAAAGLIGHADDVMDAATLAAWRRLDDSGDDTGPTDRIPLDGIVAVPAEARVGDVSAGVGDQVKPGTQILEVRAGGPFFECRARKLESGLTAHDLIFEVDGRKTPVAELQLRPSTDDRQGLLRIRPGRTVTAADARVAVIASDSGGRVLAAPLSAIRVAPDGTTSVVVITKPSSRGRETTREVTVTLGVSAQGLVAVTGDGLSAGTQVELFDAATAPTSADLSAR